MDYALTVHSRNQDAEKALQTMAMEAFALPGQHGFPFNGFFDKPEAPGEVALS